jgi:hypothetical protein
MNQNQAWHEAMYGSSLRPYIDKRENWSSPPKLTPEKVTKSRTLLQSSPRPSPRRDIATPSGKDITFQPRSSTQTSPRPSPPRALSPPKKFVPGTRDPAGVVNDVEDFLARNRVDGVAANQLRDLPPHLQREVLLWGDVMHHRSPTQLLLRHIHDVANGTHSSTTRDNSSNVLRSIWPKLHDGDVRFLLTAGAPLLSKNKGRWYYEAELGRGIEETHIGWATPEFDGEGCVGRDDYGWAADGLRHLFWHGGPAKVKWPQTWQAGDIIGCAVDLDIGELIFFHNGMWALPAPLQLDGETSIFPAVSTRGEFTLYFTEATFSYFPAELGFKPLMELDEARSIYGCRGAFKRPGPQDEIPPESPREKGVRLYKDTPKQKSVVDMVVFGRDMDFNAGKQFTETWTDRYKGYHGIPTKVTDIEHTVVDAKTGFRRLKDKPENRSVVPDIITGRDPSGDTFYNSGIIDKLDGAAGKLTFQRGSVCDQPPAQGRRRLNVIERYKFLQETKSH